MATKIFVNLPVKDLKASMDFWKKLGYSFNEQFTDETAASLVISEDIYAMLLTHPKWQGFTKKDIVDAHKSSEVMTALSMESKQAVDDLMDKVQAAGGKARETQDYGFMYSRGFEDLDGHIWEVFWMDPNHVKN